MISVIIPSYKNPTYLDLCLRSAFEGSRHNNQIIVVLDGPCPESEDIIRTKYPDTDVIVFPENRGQSVAHNVGVTMAEHSHILIVNDDNVFPPAWDLAFDHTWDPKAIWTPNQIEPAPSIFPSFDIKDFGRTAETFQYDAFCQYATSTASDAIFGDDGQTWPIFMTKKWYMILGGVDERFPSPAVADWDFFMRAELAGLECVRIFNPLFYHFSGAQMKRTPEAAQAHAAKEAQSFAYFEWKWGFRPSRPTTTNSAISSVESVRGVTMQTVQN